MKGEFVWINPIVDTGPPPPRLVKKKKKKKKTRGEGQVYKRRDLLLDLGGGESGERFGDKLGLEDALAGQTAARCGS